MTFQVPATLDEALLTSLIGLFEKRRFRNFLSYLAKYDPNDPNTYGGAYAPVFLLCLLYGSVCRWTSGWGSVRTSVRPSVPLSLHQPTNQPTIKKTV